MDLKNEIIEMIRKNRISSTEVADALGKTGHIEGPHALSPGYHVVGEVEFIYTYDGSNWPCHEQLQDISQDKILYCHAFNCEGKAVFGDIVSKYIMLYKQARGIVVNGQLRDVHRIIKEKYPAWCTGVTPIGCVNAKPENPPPEDQVKALREQIHGGIMVCDDSGVVLIRRDQINSEIINHLNFIELQEDIWYYCMDSHKMSTYEIICEKKYLTNPDLIDQKKLDDLKSLNKKTS